MFCLPVHVKTSLPPAQNVNEIPVISASAVQFVHFCVTVNNSILLFVCLFIYLFVYLFICLFIYLLFIIRHVITIINFFGSDTYFLH